MPTLLSECIISLYSSKAQTFPLGIKMKLVPKFTSMTNEEAHAKASRFQALQAHFLAQTETSLLCVNPDTVHNRHTMYETLHAFSLTSHHMHKMAQPLFYAINPMKQQVGYLVRYLPQQCTKAHQVIAQNQELFPNQPSQLDPNPHPSQSIRVLTKHPQPP